ncbi:MAG: S1 RNA-binding domain-containing protein [Bacteroidales bacterium]|nr:S1 RNA-binding domain-containing protein [Bacteroidales bacterium]
MGVFPNPEQDYASIWKLLVLKNTGEFIGAIIGKGGETIQKIQRETGTTITITEQQIDGAQKGVVDIFGLDKESMDKAISWINGITAVPEVDAVYHGKIVSILEFGAFVEILPGKEGLLHVSEIDWKKTEKVEDVLAIGDEVDVKLLEIDAKTGKMRLSRKALIEKPEGYVEPERKPRGGDRGPRREERRDNGRGPRRDDRGPRRDDRGPRGPRRDRREEPAQNETNNEPEMF